MLISILLVGNIFPILDEILDRILVEKKNKNMSNDAFLLNLSSSRQKCGYLQTGGNVVTGVLQN